MLLCIWALCTHATRAQFVTTTWVMCVHCAISRSHSTFAVNSKFFCCFQLGHAFDNINEKKISKAFTARGVLSIKEDIEYSLSPTTEWYSQSLSPTKLPLAMYNSHWFYYECAELCKNEKWTSTIDDKWWKIYSVPPQNTKILTFKYAPSH